MKRRNVLLGSAALIAAPSVSGFQLRAQAAKDPDRLNKDLTPFGAERAGNATGTIPAWTGEQGAPTRAEITAETPLFTVTAANLAQYADMLCEGQQLLLKKFPDYKINVYKTHRIASAPQYVYDALYKNVTRAQPAPGGYINGFTGTVNGQPFPILDDDPVTAGIQAIWNHQARWQGNFYTTLAVNYLMGNGTRTLTSAYIYYNWNRYYDPSLTPETLYQASKFFNSNYLEYRAPPNLVGGKFDAMFSFQPAIYPATTYEYLVGEGRIREAPPSQYDIPSSQTGDSSNFDESNGFLGAMDRYNWKLVGKKEMIVPYNNTKMYDVADPFDLLKLDHLDQDYVRYEIHRMWVVEAHLAPGKRMTEPFRRFYLDEDTWVILDAENYDDQGNYWKYITNYNEWFPELPGLPESAGAAYNFQEGVYFMGSRYYNAPPPLGGFPTTFESYPISKFDVQSMANSGGL